MSHTNELSRLIFKAVELSNSLGNDFEELASRFEDLHERLIHGQFHLAVLGQFKRGKSTLLNALLGEEILPASVVPLTAIPTFIRYGKCMEARVDFQDGDKPEGKITGNVEEVKSFLAKFVTEEENPKNRFGVSHVEVKLPAPILSSGMVLIDTPGVGSTFQHNTEATLNFLPQCDAALFLVSADPPITEVEVEFLREARKKIPRFFFVLNKVDYLEMEERRVVERFLKEMLIERVGVGRNTEIISLSAREGLRAKLSGDSIGWKKSGMADLEEGLLRFMADEKSKALFEALSRKTLDMIADIRMRLELRIRSLEMPLEDLEERLDIFERKVDEIRRERERVSDLLEGDKRRMFNFLEELSNKLREDAGEYLQTVIKEAMALRDGDGVKEEDLQEAVAKAIPGYFEHQSGVTTESISARMSDVLRSYQDMADQLIESVRKTAADLFEISYRAPKGDKAFKMVKRPYWVTHKWSSGFTPIPSGAIEKLLPPKIRHQRILKRMDEQIETLVRNNVENLRWTIYQSVNETFRSFGNRLDEKLSDTLGATHGAIKVAVEERKRRSDTIASEVLRLRRVIEEFAKLEQLIEV